MLYVVTAVHNRFRITEKFVMLLKMQSYQDFQLVFIDDGCTDGTELMVKRELPNSITIHGNGKLFWGGALHKAYLWLKDNANDLDYVMFANDDTSFDTEYISTAIKHLNQEPGCLITGCGHSLRSNKQIDGVVHWDYRKGGRLSEFSKNDTGNCASTRSLFFNVNSMKLIGGFHPILLPHYASDFEWTLRGAKKGIIIKSFSDLNYFFDEGTTGDNIIDNLTAKKLFSKRSNKNPIYRLSFILLSTPIKHIPTHIGYQIVRYLKRAKQFVMIMKR